MVVGHQHDCWGRPWGRTSPFGQFSHSLASRRPLISNLNAAKDQAVANATITDLGVSSMSSMYPDGFSINDNRGAVNVLVTSLARWTTRRRALGSPALAISAAHGPRTWTSKATAQPERRVAR